MNDMIKNDVQIFIKKIIKNKNLKINHNIFHNEILKKFMMDYNVYIKAYNKFIPTFIDENNKSQHVNIFVLTTLSYILVEMLELIKIDMKSLISCSDSNNITYGKLIKKLCKKIGYDYEQSKNIHDIFLVEFRNAVYHMDYHVEDEYLIFPNKEKKYRWNYEELSIKLQNIQIVFDIINVEITKRTKIHDQSINLSENYPRTIIEQDLKNDVDRFLHDLKNHNIFKIYADKFYSRTTTQSTLNYAIYHFTLSSIILNDGYMKLLNDYEYNIFFIKSHIIALNGAIELINKFLKEIFVDHKKTNKSHATLESLIINLCDMLHYNDQQKIKYNEIFLSDFRSATTHIRYCIEDSSLICVDKSKKIIWDASSLKDKMDLINIVIDMIKEFHTKNDLPTDGF